MKAARVGNTVLSPVSIQKYASKIKSAQETQQTQEMMQAKNKSTQMQVTQLTHLGCS